MLCDTSVDAMRTLITWIRAKALIVSNLHTVKPRYNAPDFNIIPSIEHINFGSKKYFYSYFHIANSENLGLKHNFGQSLDMRYSEV